MMDNNVDHYFSIQDFNMCSMNKSPLLPNVRLLNRNGGVHNLELRLSDTGTVLVLSPTNPQSPNDTYMHIVHQSILVDLLIFLSLGPKNYA